MPDLLHWSSFFSATIVLLLIPGPSVMYVVTRGLEYGYRGVFFSSIGLALGDLLQVFCTVVGLSTLLASSTVVYTVVQYAGAAYLIVLGLYRLVGKRANLPPQFPTARRMERGTSGSLVLQAFFALNPKTAVFFLALFPQFMVANAGPVWRQILLFGCTFVFLGFTTNSLYGCLGGTIASLVKEKALFSVATRYIGGTVLVGMGIAAGVACSPARPV